MRQTIAQGVISEMQAKGYTLLGETSGTYSFRKGSNLHRYLEHLGVTQEQVEVRTGARAGKNMNDGYQLLVFRKEAA